MPPERTRNKAWRDHAANWIHGPPLWAVLRASWCHAADWAHSRVAFTSSQGTNSPAHAGLGLRPSLRSKLPYGPVLRASHCHAAAASQRAASLRLGQIPAPLGGSWAFALAPVHPRCFARLRASGLDETDTNSSPVSYHTSGPLSTRFSLDCRCKTHAKSVWMLYNIVKSLAVSRPAKEVNRL